MTSTSNSATTPARQFTEPLRELGTLVLLGGNAVLLFVGFIGLVFVVDGWATDFGRRCAAVFDTFVGPVSLGLPLLAVLLATHVAPMLARSRLVLLVALVEYGVSAAFGLATFLGAFAYELSSARSALEGVLGRAVWLGFLVFGCLLLSRIWIGLYPPAQSPGYGAPGQRLYGRPQPSYDVPTADDGWPLVPAPPAPHPLAVPIQFDEPDPTMRISSIPPEPAPAVEDLIEPPTRRIDGVS